MGRSVARGGGFPPGRLGTFVKSIRQWDVSASASSMTQCIPLLWSSAEPDRTSCGSAIVFL